MSVLKKWANWRRIIVNAYLFMACLLLNGCAVTTTASGRTYVEFSFIWLLICFFTGPIGIGINVLYVICKLSGCEMAF